MQNPNLILDPLKKSLNGMIQQVPALDAWRGPYEYSVTTDVNDPNALQRRVGNIMGIRSLGRDATLTGSGTYTIGPFLSTDYDQDIVWADGYLVKYPAGVSGSAAAP